MKVQIETHGRRLLAFLKGPTVSSAPIILMLHGGAKGDDHTTNDAMSDAFARRGFRVLCLNLSGHGESDVAHGSASRLEHLEDAKAAFRYARDELAGGDARVQIYGVGYSYGAYILSLMAHFLNALVVVAPALYPDSYLEMPNELAFAPGIVEAYRQKIVNPDSNRALSAIRSSGVSLMVINRFGDRTSPPTVAQSYEAAAASHASRVTLPGSKHVFSKEECRLLANEIVRFIHRSRPVH